MSAARRLATATVLVLLLAAPALSRFDAQSVRPLLRHVTTTMRHIADAVSASSPGTRLPRGAHRSPASSSTEAEYR
ncbi:hypothetical protein GCM10010302_07020 [Streptomyces polychromogenes]|uniref:Uncharacterized protein n=1 Tax=Streptomyces polychromogenes TaxID=67342 RepID=A0ABN0V2F2_9ACTN